MRSELRVRLERGGCATDVSVRRTWSLPAEAQLAESARAEVVSWLAGEVGDRAVDLFGVGPACL